MSVRHNILTTLLATMPVVTTFVYAQDNYNYGNNGNANTTNNYGLGGNNTGGNAGGNNYGNGDGNNEYGGNNNGGNAYGGNTGGNGYGGNTNTGGNAYGGNGYGGAPNSGGNAYSIGAFGTQGATNNIPINSAPINTAPVNTAAPLNSTATPVSLPPAPPAELEYQFEQNGAPGLHFYKLKWPDGNRNLQSIEVYRAETGDLIQTIPVPQEGLRLVYGELQEPTVRHQKNVRDQVIDAVDYNFDNFVDIRLTLEWPYLAGQKRYLIWLFDLETDQYKFSPDISALPSPRPDSKEKRIETLTLGGMGGAEWTKNFYSVSPEGKLRIETRIISSMWPNRPLWTQKDIRARVNGQLQRICKFVIPTEGRPRRTYGRRENCNEYLVKPGLRR